MLPLKKLFQRCLNPELLKAEAKVLIGHDRFHRKLGLKTFQEESCVSFKTSIPEIEANCFSAQLLINDEDFLSAANNGYTYDNLACELNVHVELALIKAQILNSQGYDINIPYNPKSNYLATSHTAAEDISNYKTY